MSGLDNIIKKITEDASLKSMHIKKESEEQANAKADSVIAETNKAKADIISEAKTEAVRLKEQLIVGKNLEIRNNKLAAKQQMIDKVFDESLNKLNNMSEDEYMKFLNGYISSAEITDNCEIILPEKYQNLDVKKLNPLISLYSGSRKIDGGFILVSGGIEQNNTFEALIDYYRNELEQDVIQKLF